MGTKTTTQISFPAHDLTLDLTISTDDSQVAIQITPVGAKTPSIKASAPSLVAVPVQAKRGRKPKAATAPAATGEAPKKRGRPKKVVADAGPATEEVPAAAAPPVPPAPGALPPVPGTEDLAAA